MAWSFSEPQVTELLGLEELQRHAPGAGLVAAAHHRGQRQSGIPRASQREGLQGLQGLLPLGGRLAGDDQTVEEGFVRLHGAQLSFMQQTEALLPLPQVATDVHGSEVGDDVRAFGQIAQGFPKDIKATQCAS